MMMAKSKYGVENKGMVFKFIRDQSLRISVVLVLQKEVSKELIAFQAVINEARANLKLPSGIV